MVDMALQDRFPNSPKFGLCKPLLFVCMQLSSLNSRTSEDDVSSVRRFGQKKRILAAIDTPKFRTIFTNFRTFCFLVQIA